LGVNSTDDSLYGIDRGCVGGRYLPPCELASHGRGPSHLYARDPTGRAALESCILTRLRGESFKIFRIDVELEPLALWESRKGATSHEVPNGVLFHDIVDRCVQT